jgi:hypothetical protein
MSRYYNDGREQAIQTARAFPDGGLDLLEDPLAIS